MLHVDSFFDFDAILQVCVISRVRSITQYFLNGGYYEAKIYYISDYTIEIEVYLEIPKILIKGSLLVTMRSLLVVKNS